jgi:hypothetical protein
MNSFKRMAGSVVVLAACYGGLAQAVEVKPKAAAAAAELTAAALHPEGEWRPVKTDVKRNIRTWARLEDDKPWRSFKVEALLNTSLPALEQVFSSFDSYHEWYWQVTEAKLLKAVSPTEFYLYMVQNEPVSLPDRDVILHVTVEPRTATRPVARIRMVAEPDYLPLRPPLVRMKAEELTITLTPQAEGVLLQAEGFTLPGTQVPVWASNFVQRTAPFTMAVGLERKVRTLAAKGMEPSPFRLSLAQ